MKKFIKAIIIGYVTIWALDYVKELFRDEDVKNLDDLKRLLKSKL
jgi:hypothetical protein